MVVGLVVLVTIGFIVTVMPEPVSAGAIVLILRPTGNGSHIDWS